MNARFSFFVFFFVAFVSFCCAENPKISIITSLYKGEKFIEGFMQDIVRQTVFDQCELIIINGNSPENEEPVIRRYMKNYPNIIYMRLKEDPGIYGCWNRAIEMSRGEFITNANVDDRLSPRCYATHMKTLDERPDIDLVYSNMYLTDRPNETFECNSSCGRLLRHDEFSSSAMDFCLPGCNPMWRKSMHDKYGLFDETYKTAGDWKMWCRAVEQGAQFLKIAGAYCLYYDNPRGLSTDRELSQLINIERSRIVEQYGHLWSSKKKISVDQE